MANSSTTLQSIVAFAKTHPDIAPLVLTPGGGMANQPALTIANDVMIEIISQVFNWKWNRFALPLFYTNGFQQDYALNVINLGWLENGVIIDINNTAQPKPIYPLEVVKDLPMNSCQWGMPGQVSWLPNDQLNYGVWGGSANAGDTTLGNNPQPLQVLTSPIGVLAMPNNPILQVKDSFGNLWVVTGYGTIGATNPFLTNPLFPTPANPNQVATTVTDGSVTWTAVNPKGQGVRCNPIPPQLGIVYQFNVFGQWRPFAFSNGPFTQLSQVIEPIPDDFAKYFRDGFVSMAFQHSTESKIRAKSMDMKAQWMKSLMDMKIQGDRERDNSGFYPATSLLQQPFTIFPGPSFPFALPWG